MTILGSKNIRNNSKSLQYYYDSVIENSIGSTLHLCRAFTAFITFTIVRIVNKQGKKQSMSKK
jgi:hypothetical protein